MMKNLSEAEDAVLNCFFPEGKEMTIKQLRERAGYSYERIYTSLKGLVKKKIIFEKEIGRTLVYAIDFNETIYSKLAFYHYLADKIINFRNKHLIIYKALRELEEGDLKMILVFGSYSKGTETRNSDIDLMIVSDNKAEMTKSIRGLKYKYGLNISPVFISASEFPKIKQENPELWEDIKQNAIIFKGSEQFYYWTYQR